MSRVKYSNIAPKKNCQKNKLNGKLCPRFPLKHQNCITDTVPVYLLQTWNNV